MATFTNLYHASEVVKHVLETKVIPAPVNGVLAAPPPDAIIVTEEIRVTLLWLNEQPSHRNDPPHRNFDGTMTPPPATLSLFYLVTTYGEGPGGDANGAHRLLGEVIRVFSAEPTITLPIPALPGNSGEGKLHVTLVPPTPDLMEKLFSPLQIKHRPYALYEVSPVQLKSTLATGAPMPVVAPGGLALSGPAPSQPPLISRVASLTQAEGGYLRVDGVFPTAITSVWVGGVQIVAPDLTILDPRRSLRVKLPTGGANPVLPGQHRLSVASGNLHSEAVEVRIAPAGTWTLDGPATLSHSQAAALVLTGQGLDTADLVYVWPDAGIFAPTDVRTFAPGLVTATSVTVLLSGLPTGQYRIAARIDLGAGVARQFTPYVVLEVTP